MITFAYYIIKTCHYNFQYFIISTFSFNLLILSTSISTFKWSSFYQVLAFSIRKSDMDLRKTLYSNIVLSGGSTLYRGTVYITIWVINVMIVSFIACMAIPAEYRVWWQVIGRGQEIDTKGHKNQSKLACAPSGDMFITSWNNSQSEIVGSNDG